MNETRQARLKEYLEKSLNVPEIALQPEDHVSRGNAYFELDELEAALAEYEAALAERPSYIDALVNKATVLARLDRLDDAAETLRLAIQKGSEQDYAVGSFYHLLAQVQYKQKQFQDALLSASEATQKWNDPDAMYLRARLHSLLHQADESVQWLRNALPVKPSFREAARTDPAFDNIRSDPRFQELVGSADDDARGR